MSSHMYYMSTEVSKSFITLTTWIWFLPSVSSHMYYMSTQVSKSFNIQTAWIWFSWVCLLIWIRRALNSPNCLLNVKFPNNYLHFNNIRMFLYIINGDESINNVQEHKCQIKLYLSNVNYIFSNYVQQGTIINVKHWLPGGN